MGGSEADPGKDGNKLANKTTLVQVLWNITSAPVKYQFGAMSDI